jgi:hypothetical protein
LGHLIVSNIITVIRMVANDVATMWCRQYQRDQRWFPTSLVVITITILRMVANNVKMTWCRQYQRAKRWRLRYQSNYVIIITIVRMVAGNVRGGDTYKPDGVNIFRYGARRGSVNKI